MPRYYFHIRDGDNLIHDREGMDLRGPREALDEAYRGAKDAVVESIRFGDGKDGRAFEVHDDLNSCLFTYPFIDALPDK